MYRKSIRGQLTFEDFYHPFGGKLNGQNRWVKLSELIPWEEFEEEYSENFTHEGAIAKPFRMALGALIIKEKLNLTDEETVAQIQENPYLQFFIGYQYYREEPPFDPSSMVHFRRRIDLDLLTEINERIHQEQLKKNRKKIRNLKKKKKLL